MFQNFHLSGQMWRFEAVLLLQRTIPCSGLGGHLCSSVVQKVKEFKNSRSLQGLLALAGTSLLLISHVIFITISKIPVGTTYVLVSESSIVARTRVCGLASCPGLSPTEQEWRAAKGDGVSDRHLEDMGIKDAGQWLWIKHLPEKILLILY